MTTSVARISVVLTALVLLILLNSSAAVSVARNAHTQTQAAAAESSPGFFSRVIDDAIGRTVETFRAAFAANGELVAELSDKEIIPASVFDAVVWQENPAEVFLGNLYRNISTDIKVAVETDRYLLAQAIEFLLQPK